MPSVQFFERGPSREALTSSALGQAVGEFGGQLAGQAIKRGQLKSALDETKAILNDPNASQQDKMIAMMKAGAGIPGSEKYMSTLLPEMLKMSQSQQYTQGLGGGEGPGKISPNQPQVIGPQGEIAQPKTLPQPEKKTTPVSQKQAEDIEKTYVDTMHSLKPELYKEGSPYGNIPTFDYNTPMRFSPEDEKVLREKYKNFPPDVQDRLVQRAAEDVQNRYQENLQKFNLTREQQQAIEGKWKDFTTSQRDRLENNLEGFKTEDGKPLLGTQEELKNNYYKYARELPVNMTPEQMHESSMSKLNEDIDRLNQIKQLPMMPPIRRGQDFDEYFKEIGPQYKYLWDKGYKKAVREDAIYNKNMGIEEMHNSIWGDQTNKNLIKELSNRKYKLIPEYLDTTGRNEQDLKHLSNALKKIGPEDDLILLRAGVLNNGGDEKLFQKALKESGVKLSPFQEEQLSEIAIPRWRPLGEIFNPGYWSALWNSIAGKK